MYERAVAVIPAFNEEKHISEVVKQAKKYCDVVVVDDYSSDKTSELALKSGAHIIKHEKNKGYGSALLSGFDYALKNNYEYIITLDGDGQHNPEDIPKFINAFDLGADIISGSRFLFYRVHCSWKRKLAIKALTTFAYLLSDLNLSDIQSGFRAYKAEVLRNIKLNELGMSCSVELPIKAKRKGFTFMEIPIEIKYFHDIPTFWKALKQGISVGFAILKYSLGSR